MEKDWWAGGDYRRIGFAVPAGSSFKKGQFIRGDLNAIGQQYLRACVNSADMVMCQGMALQDYEAGMGNVEVLRAGNVRYSYLATYNPLLVSTNTLRLGCYDIPAIALWSHYATKINVVNG